MIGFIKNSIIKLFSKGTLFKSHDITSYGSINSEFKNIISKVV